MTRRRLQYELWRAGRLPGYLPTFADLRWLMDDDAERLGA